MSPEEKHAWFRLATGILMVLAFVAAFVAWDSQGLHLRSLDANWHWLMLPVFVSWIPEELLLRRWRRREAVAEDERDKAVRTKAWLVAAICAWAGTALASMVLVFIYNDRNDDGVPVDYLMYVFYVGILVFAVTHGIASIVEYRRR